MKKPLDAMVDCPDASGFFLYSSAISRSTSSSRVAQLVAMRMTVTSSCFSQKPILTCAERCASCTSLSARKIWFVGLYTAR